MLKLTVTIDLEGYDNSRMAAAAALRVAFLSSAVGGSIRGWTIHEMTLVEEGNAAFDELRASVDEGVYVDEEGVV
jgi:predicted Zn-dependent protease